MDVVGRFILRAFLFSLLILPIVGQAQQKVYQYKKADGTVVFSDTPRDGATEVELQPLQSFSSQQPQQRPNRQDTQNEQALEQKSLQGSRQAYTSVKIVEPTDQATIWSSTGDIQVDIAVKPNLQAGDTLQILVDGKPYATLQDKTSTVLSGIDRGSHTISAKVISNNGQELMKSNQVVVFLHQAAVGATQGPRPVINSGP